MPQYYFAIASKKFLTNEEPIEEILRERKDYYERIGREIDFWLVDNPDFIHLEQFKQLKKQLNSYSTAIISRDRQFIQWLKLRIGYIAIGYFESKL